MQEQSLVASLDFQLTIQSGSKHDLHAACDEARNAANQAIRLAKQGVDWDTISDKVEADTNLVQNTTQCIVDKALDAMRNYYEYDDYGLPSHEKDEPFPLRANYTEGYNLWVQDDGTIEFRVSGEPYQHIEGVLDGSDDHLSLLRTALSSSEWRVGTAEALFVDGRPELHVTVTNTEQTVRDKQDSRTVIGVDVNEDNVALTALSDNGVEDSIVIDFPEVKEERHRYFTMRKRIREAGKESMLDVLAGREKRFVRDRLHKLSRSIVEWAQRFESPVIVLEDLKDMRDDIEYGVRMNRRLHHLPFRKLQQYVSYKAAFEGVPTAWIDPAYTSQRCPMCGHTEKANRHKKRFDCCGCAHQDHSDRGASVNIAVKGVRKHLDWTVPALNSLPTVRKMRREASGAVDAPTATHSSVRDDRDPFWGVASRTVGVSD